MREGEQENYMETQTKLNEASSGLTPGKGMAICCNL
jgi:hypothetical protein